MSSVSDAAECATATAGSGIAANPPRIESVVVRWMMFSDYGAAARRHMSIVWLCVLASAFADALWLPNSGLTFASSNWTALLHGVVVCALAAGFIAVAFMRLSGDASRAAAALRAALTVTELLSRAVLPIGALLTAGVTLSYLITAENLPLQDALLAHLDHELGFQWLQFLQATNSSTLLATFLTGAYQTIGPIAELVIVWLAVSRRGDRLAELLAILSVSTVTLCVGMWLVPAAGAYAYFAPAPQFVANFSAWGELWPFAHAFTMLREGSLSVIDLSALQGVVSFPSFHTMLGVMTIYAVRDTRWLMIPVLLVNGAMFVATLPVGGHHLTDVVAGAGLTSAAILLVRCRTGFRARPAEIC